MVTDTSTVLCKQQTPKANTRFLLLLGRNTQGEQKKMIVYREPEALPSSSKSLKYTELGTDNIKDFSTESNNLHCSDYKKAHSTNRLADPRLMNNRRQFNNIGDVEADRSNISYVMTEEDLIKEAKRKRKEQKLEQRRIRKQQELDNQAERNFELINNLMVRYKT